MDCKDKFSAKFKIKEKLFYLFQNILTMAFEGKIVAYMIPLIARVEI